MTVDIIEDVAQGRLALPPVPRVLISLVALLRNPDVDIDDIVDEIEQDPVLAGRTLQLANSPFYGGRRSVASIPDAVNTLGTATIQRIVVTAGMESTFQEVPGVALPRFWAEATIVATLARATAALSTSTRDLAESAYLAGLLHASGHLILCAAYPDLARGASRPGLRGRALAALEQSLFGAAHPAVGAAWITRLALPHEVAAAVSSYLDPEPCQSGLLSGLVALAAQLAGGIADQLPAADAIAGIDESLLARLNVPAGKFRISMGQRYDELQNPPLPV